ncbi:lytic transglycosylase domain-containing protein [Paracnuella aquatica]|nr:lytic transglycosylase domain-containing protein [Paracnuella aquatica]
MFMRKTFILFFGLLVTAAATHAGGLQAPLPADTLVKGLPADPKSGFRNLFERGNKGLNTAKLNPLAITYVQDYMQRFGPGLQRMKDWAKPQFDMMDGVLAKHGLPIELKYLAVIESRLQPFAVSWAGAVGPWQFMEGTGRDMGLRIGATIDERTDFFKSTHAAARYLNQLYRQYGDWLLVIAAYNCGPGGVQNAIRRSGSRNFWDLQYHLPEESRMHVKKFIATHYIMEGQGSVATLTQKEAANELMQQVTEADANTEVIPVSGKYHSLVIAQHLQMDKVRFDKLNPNFDKALAANGSYNLRLPADKALQFQASKPQILEQSIRLMLSMN